MVNPEHLAAARALKPLHERPVFGRSVLLFDGVGRDQLETMGEVRRPSIADLFVAVMTTDARKPEKVDLSIKEEKGVLR
jgi:ABC-2 type transport system ATP-binding protein